MSVKRQGRVITVSGTDLASVVSIPTSGFGSASGDRIFLMPLHPDAISLSSRLSKLGSTFEAFRFTRAHVRAKSDSAATTKGSVLLYRDPDPRDVPQLSGGSLALAPAMAHGGKITNLYEGASCEGTSGTQKWYWIEDSTSDARLTQQGFFCMLTVSTPGAAVVMTVEFDWTVKLRMPNDEAPPVVAGSAFAQISCSNPGATAAVPYFNGTDFAAQTSVIPYNWPTGLGVAYNAAGSFIYWSANYPKAFGIVAIWVSSTQAAKVSSTPTSNSGIVLGDAHQAVGTNLTTSVEVVEGAVAVVSPGPMANTGAAYWNGSRFVNEPTPASTPNYWYIGFTGTTLTTPASFNLHVIINVNTPGVRRFYHLRQIDDPMTVEFRRRAAARAARAAEFDPLDSPVLLSLPRPERKEAPLTDPRRR
jgi:hypothetical protein